jgi:hypothetical protein
MIKVEEDDMGMACSANRGGNCIQRKTLLGRPRCRWEDNITVDLKEIGWEDVDWTFCLRIGSSLCLQQPIVITLLNFQVS